MRSSGERGSVSVEFAAVLPLVAVTMLLVAQMGLLVSEQLAVQHAAREGARTAAVSNDDDAARDAALRAGNLDPDRTTIEVSPATRDVGTRVTVTVHYEPVEVPLVGRFMPADVRLHSAVSMRTERAPPDEPPAG
jgi:Flp pilus assembly protein TadG